MRYLLMAAALAIAAFGWLGVRVLTHEAPRIVRPTMPANLPDAVEMRFANGDLALGGQLFRPPEPARAAAVIIHGSGTSHRENGWYGALTGALLARGIAVLLTDKRGTPPSGGDWRSATMADLAGDARAAGQAMRQAVPDVPLSLVGVSQGGWVASIVAQDPGPFDAVVSLSGSAVRPSEVLVHEERNTMREDLGLPGILARVLAPVTAWRIRKYAQPEFWQLLEPFYANEHWAHARVPAFVAFGALDEFDNVPVAESVARLKALGNPLVDARVYPEVGHGFFDYGTGVLDARFLSEMAEFVAAPQK